MLLFSLLASFVVADSGGRADLHLVRCTFIDGRHQASPGEDAGKLVHLVSAGVAISKVSVFADQKSSQSLFKCYEAEVSLHYCFLKDLRAQFGCFFSSRLNIDSSEFSNSVRPLAVYEDRDMDRIRMWGENEPLTCRNVTFEDLRAPRDGYAGAILYSSDTYWQKVSLTNCTFRNCRCGGALTVRQQLSMYSRRWPSSSITVMC